MPVSIYEWEKTVSGGDWIEVTSNKVINLILRELNNLIKINSNNEVYVDLQLDDNLQSSSTIPVGVNVWRVLQANGFPVTWTLITAKTTSWDTVKVLYGDDGEIRVDNGTGTWKNITTAYFKTQAEYDALPAWKTSDWNLYIIVDNHINWMPWSDVMAMQIQDALAYLNQDPQSAADYYYWEWDVNKNDVIASNPGVPFPAWKHLYLYSWWTGIVGYYAFYETDLTDQELDDLEEDLGASDVFAIKSWLWGYTTK